MSKIIHLLDRSAGDLDDKCGMAYWLNRHQSGQGVVPVKENIHLRIGKEIHEDLASIGESTDPEEAADRVVADLLASVHDGTDQAIKEQVYRRCGWVTAFALYIEPRLRKDWENVSIEGELILDRSPLWVPTQPDRIMRHKKAKPDLYRYLEYKSTKSASSKWLASWTYAIQLHIGMAAVEEELGINLAYANIIGVMKGEERDGQLRHPYVWGYYNTADGRWTHDYNEARGGQWILRPIWDFEQGIKAYVTMCGEAVAQSQFPFSPPVMLDQRKLDSWVRRKTVRMAQVAAVKDLCQTDLLTRGVMFEQRTTNCAPPYGDPCPYRLACWNASVAPDPLGSPEYEARIPHHAVEILLRKEGRIS